MLSSRSKFKNFSAETQKVLFEGIIPSQLNNFQILNEIK